MISSLVLCTRLLGGGSGGGVVEGPVSAILVTICEAAEPVRRLGVIALKHFVFPPSSVAGQPRNPKIPPCVPGPRQRPRGKGLRAPPGPGDGRHLSHQVQAVLGPTGAPVPKAVP